MVLALYTAALACAVLVTLTLAVVGLTRRRLRGATSFVGLVLAGAVYSFGSIFEIRSLNVPELKLWLSVEYFGIATIGPLWLFLAGGLSLRLEAWERALAALLFLPALLTIAAVFTNDSHHLYYRTLVLTYNGPFSIPRIGKGPLYWANFAYMNLCILGGVLLVLRYLGQAGGALRRQGGVLLLGALIPWLGMALYQLGLSPYGLDVAPFGVALSALAYGWGIFRYRLFDLSPVAHRHVFEGLRDGVVVTDPKGRLLAVNPAMSAVFPGLVPERYGEPIDLLLADYPGLVALLRGRGSSELDLSVPAQSGTRHYEAATSTMRDGRGRLLGLSLTLRDITSRVELLARMERMAVTDELTGLANRRAFTEAAGREIERARRQGLALGLAIMDLDHFKQVNDRHGHQAGDRALRTVARCCSGRLRVSDLLCRWGGEEFAILLLDLPREEALAILERTRAAIEALSVPLSEGEEGAGMRLTASFGLCHRELLDGEDLSSLLSAADSALYRAKDEGRNRVVLGSR